MFCETVRRIIFETFNPCRSTTDWLRMAVAVVVETSRANARKTCLESPENYSV